MQAVQTVMFGMMLGIAAMPTTGCSSGEGCETDLDCKGDRVCNNGACQEPGSGSGGGNTGAGGGEPCGQIIKTCGCEEIAPAIGAVTSNTACESGQGITQSCSGQCDNGDSPWFTRCYCADSSSSSTTSGMTNTNCVPSTQLFDAVLCGDGACAPDIVPSPCSSATTLQCGDFEHHCPSGLLPYCCAPMPQYGAEEYQFVACENDEPYPCLSLGHCVATTQECPSYASQSCETGFDCQ
ncbi:MAG: hypothetical protein HOW73_11600 [Polyangiaceae bacterium]|nr:hypothetical protein [Polyangiaceae bacterium]